MLERDYDDANIASIKNRVAYLTTIFNSYLQAATNTLTKLQSIGSIEAAANVSRIVRDEFQALDALLVDLGASHISSRAFTYAASSTSYSHSSSQHLKAAEAKRAEERRLAEEAAKLQEVEELHELERQVRLEDLRIQATSAKEKAENEARKVELKRRKFTQVIRGKN